jgi:hypothetical protein
MSLIKPDPIRLSHTKNHFIANAPCNHNFWLRHSFQSIRRKHKYLPCFIYVSCYWVWFKKATIVNERCMNEVKTSVHKSVRKDLIRKLASYNQKINYKQKIYIDRSVPLKIVFVYLCNKKRRNLFTCNILCVNKIRINRNWKYCVFLMMMMMVG